MEISWCFGAKKDEGPGVKRIVSLTWSLDKDWLIFWCNKIKYASIFSLLRKLCEAFVLQLLVTVFEH